MFAVIVVIVAWALVMKFASRDGGSAHARPPQSQSHLPYVQGFQLDTNSAASQP
jgi:hypothetical protein